MSRSEPYRANQATSWNPQKMSFGPPKMGFHREKWVAAYSQRVFLGSSVMFLPDGLWPAYRTCLALLPSAEQFLVRSHPPQAF